MRRYFLTVSDKNPIMFNDMLCEYCAVEIGPLHGGGGRCLLAVCLPQLAHCLHGGFKLPGCRFVCASVRAASLEDLMQVPETCSSEDSAALRGCFLRV